MSVAVPLHDGQDFYVPGFRVKRLADARWLPDTIVDDVMQISYSDDLKRIDSYKLTVNNWDAELQTFKYSDGPVFLPGMQLELWLGYHGGDQLRRMIRGPITAQQPSFPAAGQPTLEVAGENVMRVLQNERRSHAYRKQTDSQIAREVGQRLGIEVRTDAAAERGEEKYAYVLQRDQPSILFLLERARRIGYDLYVCEDDERKPYLRFRPSHGREERPTYELTYGSSLIQFQPSLDTTDQVSQVKLRSWDNVNKRLIEHTARRDQLRTRGVGAAGDQRAIERSFADSHEVVTELPVQTPQEAGIVATETLENNAKGMLTASGSTIGLPDLRAGSVIHVNGVGRRYSGRYFVTGTTHTIGESGYTTQFNCRREEL